MAENNSNRSSVIVNSAPVLTLWAAIVAEVLGFDHDEALTLGRAGNNQVSCPQNCRQLSRFGERPNSTPRQSSPGMGGGKMWTGSGGSTPLGIAPGHQSRTQCRGRADPAPRRTPGESQNHAP